MKTLKKMATLGVALAILASCNTTQPSPETSTSGLQLTTCPPVTNPLEAPFVVELLENIKTSIYYNNFFLDGGIIRVSQGQYQGSLIYLQEHYKSIDNGKRELLFARAYNCKGTDYIQYCYSKGAFYENATAANITYLCAEDKYLALRAATTNITLIYERK